MFEVPSAQTISRNTQGISESNQNDISCTSVIFGKPTTIGPVVKSIVQDFCTDPIERDIFKRFFTGDGDRIATNVTAYTCASVTGIAALSTFGPWGVVPYTVAALLMTADVSGIKISLDDSGLVFDCSKLIQLSNQLRQASIEQRNKENSALPAANNMSDQSLTTLSVDDERTLLYKIIIGLLMVELLTVGSIGSGPVGIFSCLASSGLIAHDILKDIFIHDESGYKLDKSKLDRLYNLLKQSFEHDQDQKNSEVTVEDIPVVQQPVEDIPVEDFPVVQQLFEDIPAIQQLVEDKNSPIILKLPRNESKAENIDGSSESQSKQEEPDNNTFKYEEYEELELYTTVNNDDGFVYVSRRTSSSEQFPEGLRKRKP